MCLYSRLWYAKGTLNFSRKKADQLLALFGIVSFVEYKEFPRVFFFVWNNSDVFVESFMVCFRLF